MEIDGKKVKLQIWDTAGQERFQTITTSYYHNSDGIAVVYDVTDRDSFDAVNRWFSDVQRLAAPDVCKMLIGNKSDLNEARKVSTKEGKALAASLGVPFLETSAKLCDNVQEMFLRMAGYVKAKKLGSDLPSQKPAQVTVSISEGKKIESSSGCSC